ncbi:MAG: hypothetical protein MUF54_00290 [Polyangiaceae bacterium]|nr:hypothetical protein [Polyangiaceae bacterium]
MTWHAWAQSRPTLTGRWSASGMVERWNIGEWGPKCGSRPGAGGAPGGTVNITQTGNELTITGAGRSYSTTNCWEQGSELRRVSHSASPRGWANRCTTAANDPRRATVVTTMSASDTAISFDETGSYQFVLEGQNCTASVRRSRSFRLIQRAGDASPEASSAQPPSAASAPPSATPTTRQPPADKRNLCETPGEAARLEVRPSRKLMRPAEQFSFRADVLDAAGCRLTVQPAWTLAGGEAQVQVVAGGMIRVAEDSPEGTAQLNVSVQGRSVSVVVEVASTENYEALLATRGLNAAGEADEAAIATIAAGSLGGVKAVADDTAKKRKTVFAILVGAGALTLFAVALIMLRRSVKKRPLPQDDEPDEPDAPAPVARRASGEHVPGPGADARARQRHVVYEVERRADAQPPAQMTCPVCHRDLPPGSLFCPDDGTMLVKSSASTSAVRAPVGGICPTCERGYPSTVKYCPEHHEPLVPAPLYNATALKRPIASDPKGKICPTCGARYDGVSSFCGKDGTALVLVN